MYNRLYTVVEKSLFSDPDGILLAVYDYTEISGEIDAKSFESLKDCFWHVDFNGEISSGGVKKLSFEKRAGRRDRIICEMYDALKVLKLSGVNVVSGREFYFVENAEQSMIDTFINDNVSPYVYIRDIAVKIPVVNDGQTIKGFSQFDYTELMTLRSDLDLKIEIDDLMCVQNYFISESREPSFTELKIIESFFSENFRHTTFETILDKLETEDESIRAAWEKYRELRADKIPSLSDITKAAPDKIKGKEIAPATEKLSGVKLEVADDEEEFLLVSKCESHNRSTEAVPYDGAAGCVGGAIKDLLCAFGYPYDTYRTVGYAPTERGRKRALVAAIGYADNAQGLGVPYSKCLENVESIYSEKASEISAVLAISNGKSVTKALSKKPQVGDKIYILGTKTASDGKNCSRTNLAKENSVGEYIPTSDSAALKALIRLFTRPDFAEISVAINDISSGGIICALGEITDGANINVSSISTFYDLPFADAMLSESNERMVVCVRNESAAALEEMSKSEGVGYCKIGEVNDTKRFVLHNEEGVRVASLTSAFLLSGGAEKHLVAYADDEGSLPKSEALAAAKAPYNAANPFKKLIKDFKYDFERACIISASDVRSMKCELAHRLNRVGNGDFEEFDTPAGSFEASVRKLRYNGKMLQGKNGQLYSALVCASLPEISKNSPFKGAYLSVFEAVVKLIAAGYGNQKTYLTLEEYFPAHKNISRRLGVSVSAMLGCFEAQMQLGIPSVGGRISVGDSENECDSAITAYAFCVCNKVSGIGKSFQKSGNKVILISSELEKNGLPNSDSIDDLKEKISELVENGSLVSAASVFAKNPCSVIMEMCFPLGKGVKLENSSSIDDLFDNAYGAIVCEIKEDADIPRGCKLLGRVTDEPYLIRDGDTFDLTRIFGSNENTVAYPDGKRYLYLKEINDDYGTIKPVDGKKVKVLIPVTGYSVPCDGIVKKFNDLGASVILCHMREPNVTEFTKRLKTADILFLTDTLGSEGFMNTVFSKKSVVNEINALRERGGLVYGYGTAAKILIKNGLVELDTEKFKLVGATDGILRGEYVMLGLTSQLSPFTRGEKIGGCYKAYVYGKPQKLQCDVDYADELAREGRIITQYGVGYNRINADASIDSVCSRDGKVLVQMSIPYTEESCLDIVENAIKYFSVF